ncbi:protein LYRIC-like isoform X2 [Anas acuta]|uniref:protein LYRIC-like isoform X2 n=1 Tax=Anas acuta TaxID=28680 RepID=UPI0035C89D00
MLGPALGAEEPGLAEGRGPMAALPALLWPLLALGAAAAALLVRRGLRRGPATEQEEEEEEEKEEEEEPRQQRDDARSSAQLVACSRLCGEKSQERDPAPAEATLSEQVEVPVNGQLVTSANSREKKLLKLKKKKKAQCSDKEALKDLIPVEKDKLQEEEGVWQTKISSREKRHLRKERLKQKDASRASQGSSVAEPAFDWDEKGTGWPLAEDTGRGKGALITRAERGTVLKASEATREESVPSQSEEDVFSNVGTWDIAEVKSCPLTSGTLIELSKELESTFFLHADNIKSKSSEDSPSRCCWSTSLTFLPADDVWQEQDDPSVIDLDSDWKAPTEEWGNWTGDEEHQTGDEREKDLPKGKEGINFCLSGLKSKMQRKKKKNEVKEARGAAGLMHQGLETREEEGPRDLISTKHGSDAVCAFSRKPSDVPNNPHANNVPGKKERRKRRKMKET